MHALLQTLKARPAAFVQSDDLAVEQKTCKWQSAKRAGYFRITLCDPFLAASVQLDPCVFAIRKDAHAVVFDFKQPVLSRKWVFRKRGKHERLPGGVNRARWRAKRVKTRAQRRDLGRGIVDFFYGKTGKHGSSVAFREFLRAGVRVGLF